MFWLLTLAAIIASFAFALAYERWEFPLFKGTYGGRIVAVVLILPAVLVTYVAALVGVPMVLFYALIDALDGKRVDLAEDFGFYLSDWWYTVSDFFGHWLPNFIKTGDL